MSTPAPNHIPPPLPPRDRWGARLPPPLGLWSAVAALGAIATPFAEYLLRSLGYDPQLPQYAGLVHYVAAAAIVLTAALNYVGVRWSAIVLNLTTGAKYGALLLLVVLAFAAGRGDLGFGHFRAAAGGGATAARRC